MYKVIEEKSPSKNLQELMNRVTHEKYKPLSILDLSGTHSFKAKEFQFYFELLEFKIQVEMIQNFKFSKVEDNEFNRYYRVLL